MYRNTMVAVVAVVASLASAQTPAETALWDSTWAQYQALNAVPLAARGMVQVSQDITIVINGSSRKDVYDIYSNVTNAQGLHPFLVGWTPIRYTSSRLDFIAYEDVPYQGAILNLSTIARQKFDRWSFSYDSETFDQPGIITRQHVTFTEIGHRQIQVTEHLVFETYPELIDTAVQGGVYAHLLVQAGLKAQIEAHQLDAVPFPEWLEDDDGCGHGNGHGHGHGHGQH